MPVDPTHVTEDDAHRQRNGRCVVLSPPGASMLGALIRALSGRWASLSVVVDEPSVMVELASGGVSMLVVVEPDQWSGLRALAYAVGRHYGDVLCMQFDTAPGGGPPRIRALASRWLDPNVFALATLEQAARDRPDPPTYHSPEPPRPPVGEAAQPDDAATAKGEATDPAAPSLGGIIVGPAGQGPSRRRKVQNLVVPAPKIALSGNTVEPPLVTEEELAMLLGPPPAETA